MEESYVIRNLAALAQTARLQVFRRLVVAGQTGMQPSALALELNLPAATLSFHLKELLNAGLVSQERQGRALIYRANFEHMTALLSYLTANCCADDSAQASSCC
jgi:ArsR family transcriptional regulator, arsenate/arsenite/antimonite-responsive transcriptional repressor